jgi:excisionase family DNA binding protein
VTPERPVLTVAEVSRILGVERHTVAKAIAEGVIPAVRVGSRVLVPRGCFDEMFPGPVEPGQRSTRPAPQPVRLAPVLRALAAGMRLVADAIDEALAAEHGIRR